MPRLERLVVQGLNPIFGETIALPRLRSLEVITTVLPPEIPGVIASSQLTALEKLVLWIGANYEDYEDSTQIYHLVAMFTKPFPALRHLGIRNCGSTDEVVEALLSSPLIHHSLGTLSAQGAEMLLAARPKLRLDVLDVSLNLLDGFDLERLYELATTVIDAQGAIDDHFVPITE